MIKTAAMPIYGKNLKKIFFSRSRYAASNATKFVQMMILGWPWPILRQGQLWSLMLLYGKNGKTMDFSEAIVVYDIKVGRCS